MDTIENQLRSAFDAAAADINPGAVRTDHLRVRTTGRRVATRAGAGTALAAAGALAVTSLTGGGTAVSTATPKGNLSLSAQVSAAMAAQASNIFHVKMTWGGDHDYGPSDSWISPDGNVLHIVTHHADGTIAEDITYTTDGGTQTMREVDHDTKTWYEASYPTPQVPADCQQPTCFSSANGGLPPGNQLGGAVVSAEGVEWMAKNGTVDTTHTRTINGKTAYSISIEPTSTHPVKPGTLWVDKESNLPVQFVIAQGATAILTDDIDWAPATPDNTAQLTAQVPDGYAKTAPDPSAVPEAKG